MEEENTNQIQEPEVAAASPAANEFVKCPCCGQMTLRKPVKPGADMMDHFMACMMTGSPYKHTYELYGGRIRVTVTQITTDSRHYVLESCSILDRWRDILLNRVIQIEDIKDCIRTYSCIVDVTVDNGSSRIFCPAEAMKAVCNEIMDFNAKLIKGEVSNEDIGAELDRLEKAAKDPSSISALPATMLMAAFQLHSQLYQIMMDAGFDENFWDRIKLG